jgi:hypothetical protein
MKPQEKTFDMLIFEAASESAARELVQADSADVAGLTTSTPYPLTYPCGASVVWPLLPPRFERVRIVSSRN